ncbi:MAG: hypothetical protein METHP_00539 [Methanoregula sp. SKADARSKE-2]|nr:MAG: hypothetical protein METHP_00539 [Methanoregula sp. SKADARSKE-2]
MPELSEGLSQSTEMPANNIFTPSIDPVQMTTCSSGNKPVRTIIPPAIAIGSPPVAGCTPSNPPGNPVQKTRTPALFAICASITAGECLTFRHESNVGTAADPFPLSLNRFWVSTPA